MRGFQLLKHKLTSAVVLNLPEGKEGLVIDFDISQVGLGRVLMQHAKVKAYDLRSSRCMRRTIQLMIMN